VTNSGSRDGDEIVQLYIRAQAGSVTRPVRELKAFRRVHLQAGERQTVTFPLKSDAVGAYNEQMQWTTEAGRFQVWIAPDSARGLSGEFLVVP
jgi:beta-glucosidase